MINKTLKEHLENEYSKEKNYQKILYKEKKVVSMKRKILNIAAIFLVIIVAGVLSTNIYAEIQWNKEFDVYKNLPSVRTKGTLAEIKEDGYAEVIDTDYITQDGISIKVNEMLLTDDVLDIDLTFKFDENVNVDYDRFDFAYSIYDENKNVYAVSSRMHLGENIKVDNTARYLYEELGIKYDKKNITALQLVNSSSKGIESTDKENRTIDMNITLRAKDKFPQSKKLYIRIFDLGYSVMETDADTRKITNMKDYKLSESKWNFEITVPDKFYERNTKELKLESQIPGIEFKNITITDTSLNLTFKSEEYDELIKIGKDMEPNDFAEMRDNILYISNKTGNRYNEINIGTTGNEKEYKMTLDVGMKYLDDLYVNYLDNGIPYRVKLIEKYIGLQ